MTPNTFKNKYPIGYIIHTDSEENPSKWCEGTWELISKGKTLVGYDPNDSDFNKIGKEIGEKEHKLTRKELPKERLKILDGRYLPDREIQVGSYGNPAQDYPGVSLNDNEAFNNNRFLTTDFLGEDNSHNNIQPSYVTYIYKRVA